VEGRSVEVVEALDSGRLDKLDWGLSVFDGVEVDRWICIASTTPDAGVGDDQVSNKRDAPVAFISRLPSSVMASRVGIRNFRSPLSLMRQSRSLPSLSRCMVYVAPGSASKTVPKKAATPADLLAEEFDQPNSRNSTRTTTSNGNGNGNGTATNNGHSWMEGSGDGSPADWSRSFHGLSSQPFDKEISEILLAPVEPADIEMKPGTQDPLCTDLRSKVQS
jgi:hypothetical protein